MKFDVYFPWKKDGVMKPGVTPHPKSWAEIMKMMKSDKVAETIRKIRSTEDKAEQQSLKNSLPTICFVGTCTAARKLAASMVPTQLVMVDVDHVKDCDAAIGGILAKAKELDLLKEIFLIHKTPRRGVRVIFKSQPNYETLIGNMDWFDETFNLKQYGDFDKPCKDFARVSFMCMADDICYIDDRMADDNYVVPEKYLTNDNIQPQQQQLFSEDGQIDIFSDEEKQKYGEAEYRDVPVKVIIEKWVEVKGAPGSGEVHNYYNDMVKNFRNILNNDKRALLYLLPRFGHSASECWSSIISICKFNSLSSLPKEFYFFLKDNGFYVSKRAETPLKKYMLEDVEEEKDPLPWLPPVFREFVRISPKDFVVSVVNAMLPVLGTLTSYLQAKYWFDGKTHTTSFFSIIYAPPGTGKSYVSRIMDLLFADLVLRDFCQQARENVWQRAMNTKSQNDKSPEMPNTSLRIIPAKNSESEFLQKQQDNHGYHMFTYAAEMDSWAKGVRAAGGNKDDMIRLAWDNDEYGQAFKSTSTFKGTVRLYWNVLITGTIDQIMRYFKNVENGLVTRCSFTTIENQEFAVAPVWKELTKKELCVLKAFTKRCDENSYEDPFDKTQEEILCTPDSKFDSEIDWRFKFKPRQTVDMEWLRPAIEKWLEEQRKKAAIDFDKARDVFRRRVAVRGFRLGIICHALWEKPRQSDLEKCIPFIVWWMNHDIENSMKLWGARYNDTAQDEPTLNNRSVYAELANQFSANDVYVLCMKLGIKSRVKQVTYQWVKMGFVKKVGDNLWEKIKDRKNEKD